MALRAYWCIGFFLTIDVSGIESVPTEKSSDKKLICYYGSWAVYRPSIGKYSVESIDPFLCTHLVYAFAGISNDNTVKSLDAFNDLEDNWGKGAFKRFTNLKKINPKLKTLLAVGGWNEGSAKYSAMASNAHARRTFARSVISFLDQYGFDGLDIDWEYPGARGGQPEDKENFVLLLKELRETLNPHGYLLTAAVSAGKRTIDTAYDIPQITKHLDFINLMTYDYHGGWESFTGHNSPLYSRPDETQEQQTLNTNFSVNYWLDNGAPPSKLILGLASYGRSFTLESATDNGLYSAAAAPGHPGPYSRQAGVLGFNEICEKFSSGQQWNLVWDEFYQAPYAFKDRQWISYDDEKSLKLKVQLANSLNLGGTMVWSVESDDFRGVCQGHRNPLLTTIHETLFGPESDKKSSEHKVVESSTRHPPRVPPSATRIPPTNKSVSEALPSLRKKCRQEGWFRDPDDCAHFWWCYRWGRGFAVQEFRCEYGTMFDTDVLSCNWPENMFDC